ncbi:3-ketosteroid reductase [Aspergillus ellipticus CBS 707.79]|uniref:3-ketosteroid reductase n=1 Tax=Aspergillus ellipticus CBS 707.79 TaxID=1448320 RepID=A0A319CSY7_9EURO|nr:3-ketosteroid reductase [Aspergillus ellipticus CBS 707.79]
MANSTQDDLDDQVYTLVTGANTGLGFSICCRLMDEFLQTAPPTRTLTIIFTTRSSKKATDTLRRLQSHLTSTSTSSTSSHRITLHPETLDLTNLLSTRTLARRLSTTIPKLDSIILNAGIGGWTGIDWPAAIWNVLTDLVHTVSWFSHKLAPAGMLAPAQTTSENEPRLGSIFCANVFGHYMLAHNLMPLLRNTSPASPGRIIWVSSLEATIEFLDVRTDLQGLRSRTAYESSKTLTDVLALTADLEGPRKWVRGFCDAERVDGDVDGPMPNTYLTHPGICGTGILPLAWPLFYLMLAAFWMARWLGSPWHTMWTYAGACAPAWLAGSAQEALDAAEEPYRRSGGGRVKWGSSTDRLGRDGPASTEILGWGYGGVVGGAVVEADRVRRRKRGMKDLTAEERVEFEELGRESWKQMEELRVLWEGILDREEAKVGVKA